MCAAIEVLLDGGQTLLITDAEDTLSWDRADRRGWAVGLYPPGEAHNDGPVTFDTADAGSPGPSSGSPKGCCDLSAAGRPDVPR